MVTGRLGVLPTSGFLGKEPPRSAHNEMYRPLRFLSKEAQPPTVQRHAGWAGKEIPRENKMFGANVAPVDPLRSGLGAVFSPCGPHIVASVPPPPREAGAFDQVFRLPGAGASDGLVPAS